MTTPPPAWSNILQGMIKSTAERQRLSAALGVTTMTLSRWASGESKPQRPHLINLLQVVHPNQRQELLEALSEQYPDLQLDDNAIENIPSDFFARILNIRTTTTESLRFWRISEEVLKQTLHQLDPNRLGMAIKLVQCMPPRPEDNKIRSLRERAGKGSSPWTADLDHDVLFLGLESLSGYAVEVRHIVSDDDLRQGGKTFPAIQDVYEVSAAAHPIRFEGRIAGCLLASSTQPRYFSQQRLNLLTIFSDLISLAFDNDDFYPASSIELRVMPKPEIQRPILANFRQRVTAKFQQAMFQHQNLSNAQIELLAWQELENELLTYHENMDPTPPPLL
jgi:hypothetical protein